MPRFGQKSKKRESSGISSILFDKKTEEKVIDEISKARTISPTDLGKKHGINIAVMKQFLREQALKGTIQPLASTQGITIYTSEKGLEAYQKDLQNARERSQKIAEAKEAKENPPKVEEKSETTE